MSTYTESKARLHEIRLLQMQIRHAINGDSEVKMEYVEAYLDRRAKELDSKIVVAAFDA